MKYSFDQRLHFFICFFFVYFSHKRINRYIAEHRKRKLEERFFYTHRSMRKKKNIYGITKKKKKKGYGMVERSQEKG
jgi:hypothetical protein